MRRVRIRMVRQEGEEGELTRGRRFGIRRRISLISPDSPETERGSAGGPISLRARGQDDVSSTEIPSNYQRISNEKGFKHPTRSESERE